MRDGRIRRAVKLAALGCFRLDLALLRGIERRRGGMAFALAGTCRLCARCCEAPGIQVGRLVFHSALLRRLFLAWQERVNGFVLVARRPRERVFVFRCSHFDQQTRRCDSYDSRPGICRDYPRLQLRQTEPEFLPGCGYRAVARNAEGWRRALEGRGLPPERLARLRKQLRLD
jgi:uncharacterized protein